MNVLILEASTSSAKAMLYHSKQGVVRVESEPYTAHTGGADSHEMNSLFRQLMAVGARTAAGSKISCIALVGSWHTLVVTDQRRNPIRPSLTWACGIGSEIAEEIRRNAAEADEIYHATGCVPNATYPLYHFLQLKKQGLLQEPFLVMDENAWLFSRLTEVWGTSRPAVAGTSMFNIHTLDWDDKVLSRMGITSAQLPKLYDHRQTFPLCSEAAKLLSLPTGIPVAMPEPDGAMNQLGAGAMRPGVMTLSIGTSAAVRLIQKEPYLCPEHANWCYYAPDTYIVGCATAGSTNCVDWFQKTLGCGMSFSELESGFHLQEDSPHFLPFLYGERCPGWDDRRTGAFYGISGRHTLHDLYGAVLEGILHNIYDCYTRLTQQCGEPETILLSGGILKSQVWTQLLADVFRREIVVSDIDQVSLLGGAAIALTAAGAMKEPADFSPQIIKRVLSPTPGSEPLMQERFQQYRELYTKQ